MNRIHRLPGCFQIPLLGEGGLQMKKVALLVMMTLALTSFLYITLMANSLAAAADWRWARGVDGADHEVGMSVAADDEGNSYITGRFYSPTISFGS